MEPAHEVNVDNNQVCMFHKIYTGLVGITLPAEINPVTRVSR